MVRLCLICERHPVETSGRCHNCQQKILAEEKRLKADREPYRFVVYKEHVVGMFQSPLGGDKLYPRLLKRDPAKLPKRRTLDFNGFVPGFSREQVKKHKRQVLSLALADERLVKNKKR